MVKRNGTTLVMGDYQISYPHLFEKWAGTQGAEPKYQVTILIPKTDTEAIQALKEAFKLAAEDKWKAKAANMILAKPWVDGDSPKRNGDPRSPEQAGHYVISAKSSRKPPVYGRDGGLIEDPEAVYGGCWMKVELKLWAYEQSGNCGVGAYINAAMKARDGERLGGSAPSSAAVFEGIGDPAPAAPSLSDDDIF